MKLPIPTMKMPSAASLDKAGSAAKFANDGTATANNLKTLFGPKATAQAAPAGGVDGTMTGLIGSPGPTSKTARVVAALLSKA